MIGMSGWYKTVCCVFVFWLLIGCGPGQDGGEAKLFALEKVLAIDTESDETAGMGLTDIRHFDIDSEGNMFIVDPNARENYIFMWDEDGSLISAFGRQGEGPGELQSPRWLATSKQDEVFVTDRGKVVVFSNTGRFIKEFRIDEEYQRVVPLDEDRFLVIAVKMSEDFSQSYQVIMCSPDLEELKILDSSEIASFQKADKVNIIPTLVYWERSDSHVYTGNTDEYEIRVFDLDGELLRRIRKDHEAVRLSEDDREEYERRLRNYPPEIRENFFIPDTFPPFRDIVALGDDWLFIRTYDAPNEGGSVHDIFDSGGDYIGSTELDGSQVKFKGDRAYCLKQKESGYRELVVYRMMWN